MHLEQNIIVIAELGSFLVWMSTVFLVKIIYNAMLGVLGYLSLRNNMGFDIPDVEMCHATPAELSTSTLGYMM